MLAGYEADERLAVFLVAQAEVMAELEDSPGIVFLGGLRFRDLRLESVLHGYSFGEMLIC